MPLCWTIGDNGIYPVNQYTYFQQPNNGKAYPEIFYFRSWIKSWWCAFLHLKNLKKDYGTSVYKNSKDGVQHLNKVKDGQIVEINQYTDYPVSKIYETLVNSHLYP
jgi:hypothetical protein